MTGVEKVKLSYSRLRKLMECPHSYELEYVNEITVPRSSAMFLGGTFHLTFSTFQSMRLNGTDLTLEDCLDLFSTLFRDQTFAAEYYVKGNADVEADYEIGLGLVRAYYPIASGIKPLAVEKEFSSLLDIDGTEVELTGKLDLLDMNAVPYDIKTVTYVPQKLRNVDLMQPTIYTLCLGGDSLDQFIYHFVLKTKTPLVRKRNIKVDKQTVDWFKQDCIKPWVKMIKSGIFPPSVSGCDLCDYKLFRYCKGFP